MSQLNYSFYLRFLNRNFTFYLHYFISLKRTEKKACLIECKKSFWIGEIIHLRYTNFRITSNQKNVGQKLQKLNEKVTMKNTCCTNNRKKAIFHAFWIKIWSVTNGTNSISAQQTIKYLKENETKQKKMIPKITSMWSIKSFVQSGTTNSTPFRLNKAKKSSKIVMYKTLFFF